MHFAVLQNCRLLLVGADGACRRRQLGPVGTKTTAARRQIFSKGKAQEKIERKRIEHTVRSIFLLQRGHLEKGGFAAGELEQINFETLHSELAAKSSFAYSSLARPRLALSAVRAIPK